MVSPAPKSAQRRYVRQTALLGGKHTSTIAGQHSSQAGCASFYKIRFSFSHDVLNEPQSFNLCTNCTTRSFVMPSCFPEQVLRGGEAGAGEGKGGHAAEEDRRRRVQRIELLECKLVFLQRSHTIAKVLKLLATNMEKFEPRCLSFRIAPHSGSEVSHLHLAGAKVCKSCRA